MKKEEQTRILYLAPGATDTKWRRLQELEMREIERFMNVGTERDSFKFIKGLGVRARDLQELLLMHRPHILHVSGQGTKEGGIVLTHDLKRSYTVDGRALAELFKVLNDNIRLIVFNASHTRHLARALNEFIDYTVSLSGVVDGQNAITFTTHFYQALSFGRTVVEAFELAKIQLRLEGEPDYRKPTLHVRDAAGAPRPLLWRSGVKSPPVAGSA